jgi:hypothetical protein
MSAPKSLGSCALGGRQQVVTELRMRDRRKRLTTLPDGLAL